MSSISDQIPRKQCSLCKENLPATTEYFYAHKTSGDGLQTRCKHCYKKIALKYIEENPDKVRESKEKYRKEHPEASQEYSKQFRLKYPERIKATNKRSRKKHPQTKRDVEKRYRERHPEKAYARRKKWGIENPQRLLDYSRARRAKKKNAGGSHTNEELLILYVIQQGKCCWCGQPMGNKITDRHLHHFENFTEDHIKPLSKGGNDYIANIVLACWRCNCSRQEKLIFTEWQPSNLLEWMREHVQNALKE
jgi:5-methylcytosine-specific restriction endonuclease McrA